MLSVELGVTVALFELTLGVVFGNVFHLRSQEWLDFIAKFGSIVLTFLAGGWRLIRGICVAGLGRRSQWVSRRLRGRSSSRRWWLSFCSIGRPAHR
jgi:ABC-type dipeptide/oligopeptide/nickel transport system permease component